jgi:hypothetical protein
MKNVLRRSTERVMRALLRSFEERADAQHQRLVGKIERLETRMDAAIAKGQAEARLLASRFEDQGPRTKDQGPRARRLGARVPQHAHELEAPSALQTAETIPTDSIVELAACSVCGHQTFTPVCEFNRFLLSEIAPDAQAIRADYALCHRCGVVVARRRPVGERFRFLVEHFEETIGRVPVDGQRGTKVLGSRRLSDEEREQLRARAVQPMFASEVPRQKNRQHLPQLLRDRLAVAAHVEILGSLLKLEQPRVLEIRPRFGAIGGALAGCTAGRRSRCRSSRRSSFSCARCMAPAPSTCSTTTRSRFPIPVASISSSRIICSRMPCIRSTRSRRFGSGLRRAVICISITSLTRATSSRAASRSSTR